MNLFQQALVWLNDPLNWTNPDGILARTREHLEISAAAVALACLVAWPIGIWLGPRPAAAAPPSSRSANLGRAIPTVALLTIFPLTFIGFGYPPIILALAVFAVPPLLANAYLGVREVDPDVRDAAARHGPVRPPERLPGRDCRSPCRTWPAGSAPPPCRWWRRPRWPRSSTAAGSA